MIATDIPTGCELLLTMVIHYLKPLS